MHLSSPGDGNAYVLCAVCSRKFRQKNVVKIQDKYNRLNGMIVCKKDADLTNEQSRPFTVKDTILKDRKIINPEPADTFVSPLQDTIPPSVPQNVDGNGHPINNTVLLSWSGPVNPGSSGISGYRIKRALSGGSFSVLIDNTGNNATTYEDTTAVISLHYEYKVAAINSAGTSSDSVKGYFP